MRKFFKNKIKPKKRRRKKRVNWVKKKKKKRVLPTSLLVVRRMESVYCVGVHKYRCELNARSLDEHAISLPLWYTPPFLDCWVHWC